MALPAYAAQNHTHHSAGTLHINGGKPVGRRCKRTQQFSAAEATSDSGTTPEGIKTKSTGARGGEHRRANAVLVVLQLVMLRDTNIIKSCGGIRFKAGVAGRKNTEPASRRSL